jgi:beta-lactam-binding protein with PASTA domain
MRTCQSCGRQNPDDRDFCECGEYLRWEPTGFVQAVTPEMAQQAAEEAAPPATPEPPEPETPAPEPPPAPEPVAAAPPPAPPAPEPAAPPPVAKTAVRQAVPAAAQQPAAEQAGASITLRLPDDDVAHGETLAMGVEPGQRERVLAMVRNQSGIVDNYELRVEGLPDDWWSIFPDTVYLVPFGSSGTYEQEVEVHVHPPRTPEAEARIWELRVVAYSKAHNRDAASESLALGIQPYVETGTKVRPERKKGRRKADYTVDVENKANAPVVVALEGTDPDGELQFGFDRPPSDIKPGQTVQTTMRVKPPKQIWIGRGQEKRFQVDTLTGDAAEERLAAEPAEADGGPPPAKRRGRFRIPGFTNPQMFRPQVYEPGVSVGPGGINFRKPQFRGPQLRGPQMQAKNFQLSNLKVPGRGGGAQAAAPTAPLLPSQGVFRQKAWLPWWLIPVLLLLILLAFLLYTLLPRNVVVPDLVGSPSAFDAEQKLTEADLRLAPQQKEKVSSDAKPGTVIGQTPAAGEKTEKDSEVAIQVAVGSGKIEVPKIVGLNLADAEKALREKQLTVGQSSPQPPDPAKEIASQIPAEGEVVQEGTPVDIFFEEPGKGKGGEDKGGEENAGGGAAGGGGGGGGGGGEVRVPEIGGAPIEEYAKTVADENLVPVKETAFNAAKAGTVFGTEPAENTEVEAGSKVKLLVSAGFPQLVFDNDKDILRVNGATGKKLDPVADGPQQEKDPAFSFDGTRVAYVGDGRVFLRDLEKPNAPAVTLTAQGDEFADLDWAPTADVNVLAMDRVKGEDRDLCLGQITGDGMTPQCLPEPDTSVGGAIHWAPDGKSILAGGVSNGTPGKIGVVRWKTKKPFSADPNDWSKGRFITDVTTPGEGAKEAAISPDGKRMAVIVKTGNNPFRLVLAKPSDPLLTNATPTGVRACKVAWRPDGRELVVVQADELCAEELGSLVRVPVGNPDDQEQVAAEGDNPTFQPLSLGG